MSDHDCLLWVGQSYPTISDFLDEARTRGCCRKVPFWPSWARRGKTRVFLAHHASLPSPDRGVIFGYFVLGGIDIVLTPPDYAEFASILKICRDANGDLRSPAHWESNVGKHCAELMIEFWRQRAPDDPLPFKLKNWQGDLMDFIHYCLDLFVSSDNGDGLGNCALPMSTGLTQLEPPRFCPVDGVRTAPEQSGRPSFYFVDTLARRVDQIFHQLLERRIRRQQAEDPTKAQAPYLTKTPYLTKASCFEALAAGLEADKETGRHSGLQEYQVAMAQAAHSLESESSAEGLQPFERRNGSLITFKPPYPFYKSIPHASFRGLVQVDGHELLSQIETSCRYRSKSHEIKLPYVVEPSDRKTSKRKEELIVDMSTELKLSKSYSERVLDWLPEMMADELRSRRVIRLPNIGTFRLKQKALEDGDGDDDLDLLVEYAPSKALKREFGEIEFRASRVLERRT